MCIFFTSLGVGVFGMMHLNDGLSLSELVPHSSAVHGFLEIEFKHFGFSSFTAVTKVGSSVCVPIHMVAKVCRGQLDIIR